MIIQCTICSDLLNPSENIFATYCGHLFHYDCLHKWIVRAKSCPHCRRKVTEKCMFRVFPVAAETGPSNEENVANLQMKLDHSKLKLSEQEAEMKNILEENTRLKAQAERAEKDIKSLKEKIIASDSALSAFKDQLKFLKNENLQLKDVREELEIQKQNVRVLEGLQKVLNGTSEEVEQLMKGYQDVRTVTVFATALKKALYESEKKISELRNSLQETKQQLIEEMKKSAEWQTQLVLMTENYTTAMKNCEKLKKKYTEVMEDPDEPYDFDDSWCLNTEPKRPVSPTTPMFDPVANDMSLSSMIKKIENADSPYLNLRQSNLGWAGLQLAGTSSNNNEDDDYSYNNNNNNNNTSYYNNNNSYNNNNNDYNYNNNNNLYIKHKYPKPTSTVVSGSLTGQEQDLSIFQVKEPSFVDYKADTEKPKSELNISYDGLGGHSTFPDVFSAHKPNILKPKSNVPKVTAKHKLKRPNPVGTQDIGQMFKKMREDNNNNEN